MLELDLEFCLLDFPLLAVLKLTKHRKEEHYGYLG